MSSPFPVIIPPDTELTHTVFSPESGKVLMSLGLMVPIVLKDTAGKELVRPATNGRPLFGELLQNVLTLDSGLPRKNATCELLTAMPAAVQSVSKGSITIGSCEFQPTPPAQTVSPTRGEPDPFRSVHTHDQGPWLPGQAIALHQLNPQHPLITGETPAHRTRLFVWQASEDSTPVFHELINVLETIYLMPDPGCGVAVFRAVIPVHSPSGKDILACIAVFEDPAHPARPAETYLQQTLHTVSQELARKVQPSLPAQPTREELSTLSPTELADLVHRQRQQLNQQLEAEGITDQDWLEHMEKQPETRGMARLLRESQGSFTGFLQQLESLILETPPDDMHDAFSASTTAPNPAQPKADINVAMTEPPPEAETVQRTFATNPRQAVQHAQRNGLDCAHMNLANANLAGLDLSGMDFSGANLKNANLAGSNLTGTRLTAACLEGALLDGATLNGALLEQAVLDHASLCGANMRCANLAHCSARHTVFSDADLTESCLDHAKLDNARLERARLGAASLVGSALENANLNEADLTCAQLSSSTANPATTMQRARLDGALLDGVVWPGCQLDHSTLTGVQAAGAHLPRARLTAAVMVGSDLRNTVFDSAHMEHANLNNCDLSGARLQQVNLNNSWLLNCRLNGANLADASLTQARLPDHEHSTPAPTSPAQGTP